MAGDCWYGLRGMWADAHRRLRGGDAAAEQSAEYPRNLPRGDLMSAAVLFRIDLRLLPSKSPFSSSWAAIISARPPWQVSQSMCCNCTRPKLCSKRRGLPVWKRNAAAGRCQLAPACRCAGWGIQVRSPLCRSESVQARQAVLHARVAHLAHDGRGLLAMRVAGLWRQVAVCKDHARSRQQPSVAARGPTPARACVAAVRSCTA